MSVSDWFLGAITLAAIVAGFSPWLDRLRLKKVECPCCKANVNLNDLKKVGVATVQHWYQSKPSLYKCPRCGRDVFIRSRRSVLAAALILPAFLVPVLFLCFAGRDLNVYGWITLFALVSAGGYSYRSGISLVEEKGHRQD